MSFSSSSLKQVALLAASVTSAVFMTGCTMSTTATNSVSSAAVLSGQLHGGNQPITGATVILYEAGTSGYGSAGTPVAQTSSANDASASFSFTQNPVDALNPTGIINPTQNVYSCPTTGNPQMYLIAKGGNTTPTGSNSNAAFIVAIGKCQSAASQFVNMNEVTTVATLVALQQYFNAGTESLGYNSSAQSAQGFANAVALIPNLVNFASGSANATFTPTSSVAGVTMTATPESSKINTIANILAACVNTVSSTSTTSANCQTLFANAVPPASADVTSQPTSSFAAATDTVQAGYFMFVNPTETQDNGPSGKLANLYNLAGGAGAPFQPTLTAQPLDWTIGVTYTPTGTCTNANNATVLASAESIAVDATGNIWFNNGASTNDALVEMSPTGSPTVCAFGAIAAGRGLTIDPAGNVWTTGSGANGVYEYLANGSTLNWPTTGSANGITSDGAGNIFYAPSGSATPYQEYVAGSAALTTSAGISVGSNVVSSTGLLYVPVDPAGRVWSPTTSSAGVYDLYPGGTSPTNGYTLVDTGTTNLTASVVNGYGGAIDASGNIFGGNTCCANAVSNTFFKIVPSATAGVTTATNSAKYLGGLVAPRSTAVDGANNVWAGMGYPTVTAALNPTGGVNIFALAEINNAMTTGLSPNGSVPATCSSTGTNCATQGGFQKAALGTVRSLAIDPSGNVWAASTGTTQTIVEIVGQAVPVVTPLSVGAKNSTLGTKP